METTQIIQHNVQELTDQERTFILSSAFFTYVYDSGLIFLEKATWDCSDSLGAVAFLRAQNMQEV